MRLDNEIYTLDAEKASELLVGKIMVVKRQDKLVRMRITETECYMGIDDTACHASKGKTERNSPLWLPGGYTYVYLCYGMYNMFNVVTGREGDPQAVLVRGVQGYFGPGKFTRFAGIDKSFNRIDMKTSDRIFIEDDGYLPCIVTSKRVGIDYAAERDRNRQWRFTDSKFAREHKAD